MLKIAPLPVWLAVLLRYALASAGSALAVYLPAGSWEQIASAVTVLVTVAYALLINRSIPVLASRLASMPGIFQVIAEAAIARRAPSSAVVPPPANRP